MWRTESGDRAAPRGQHGDVAGGQRLLQHGRSGRWVIAVLNRKGIDPRVVNLMTTPHARNPIRKNSYGTGLR